MTDSVADELSVQCRRVLVIEDEPRLRNLIVGALPDMGFSAAGVGSAEEAARWLEESKADILIMDLNLPGMSGMEMFQQSLPMKSLAPPGVVSGEPG